VSAIGKRKNAVIPTVVCCSALTALFDLELILLRLSEVVTLSLT